jgi:FkbM family methyltransferase
MTPLSPSGSSRFDQLRLLTPLAGNAGTPRYIFSTSDLHVGAEILETGAYQAEEMRWSLDYLGHPQKDRVVVEVGANIGTTTLPFLLTYGARRVEAFEPEPFNCQLLRCNLILNGAEDKAIVHQSAISDIRSTLMLEKCGWNFGDHRIRMHDTHADDRWGESDWDTVEVPSDRLDDALTTDVSDIGLVWVDSQGHEAQILDGAPELLALRRVPWIIEYWPYGLSRAGGMQRLHALIERSFTRVVDVGGSLVQGRPVEHASSDLDPVRTRVGDDYTDLLLIP